MKVFGKSMVCFVIVFFFMFTSLGLGSPTKIKEDESITLNGKLIIAKGENINEKAVKYKALLLNQPIIIIYEDGEATVTTITLWLNKKQESVFKKLLGKQVKVTGKISYIWHGPSTMPNPAKFEVTDIVE